jgi:hypothetical protein
VQDVARNGLLDSLTTSVTVSVSTVEFVFDSLFHAVARLSALILLVRVQVRTRVVPRRLRRVVEKKRNGAAHGDIVALAVAEAESIGDNARNWFRRPAARTAKSPRHVVNIRQTSAAIPPLFQLSRLVHGRIHNYHTPKRRVQTSSYNKKKPHA